MRKYSSILLLCFFSVSAHTAQAGSGAGGIIRLVNKTPFALLVTFSGVGCAGIERGLAVVCESGPIRPNGTFQYNYNWGVTTTWVNIGIHPAYWGGDQMTHPCQSYEYPNGCQHDHRVVATKAWKVTECTIEEDIQARTNPTEPTMKTKMWCKRHW